MFLIVTDITCHFPFFEAAGCFGHGTALRPDEKSNRSGAAEPTRFLLQCQVCSVASFVEHRDSKVSLFFALAKCVYLDCYFWCFLVLWAEKSLTYCRACYCAIGIQTLEKGNAAFLGG